MQQVQFIGGVAMPGYSTRKLDVRVQSDSHDDVGEFDLIIGSDILYERDHAEMLAALVDRLAAAKAKVLITCPGRSHRNRFSRLLKSKGFESTQTAMPFMEDEAPPYKGRLLCFRRGM